MKLNAVKCETSEIREYAVDSYSCQINQPTKTLPSAITKQHHLSVFTFVSCITSDTQLKLKTETKFWVDQSQTEVGRQSNGSATHID
jgi:hypothetical protein